MGKAMGFMIVLQKHLWIRHRLLRCSAELPPTQDIVAHHLPAHPTTKLLKPLCQFKSAWEVIPGISLWLLGVIECGYALQFRCRPPCFNSVVQSLTAPLNSPVLRTGGMRCVRELLKNSRYFVVPKRDGGLCPILDLRPINRVLCQHSFWMITLKQIRPRDWFSSVDLKDAYFHIQIAPLSAQMLSEVCLWRHSIPILCTPVRDGFGPRTFSKCMDAALSPLRASRMCILNYLADWLALAPSRDTLLSHIDTLGLCVNIQKSIFVLSQSITHMGVCFDSVEMRARLFQ